jgi:DNA-binding transcriptional regulator YiaG
MGKRKRPGKDFCRKLVAWRGREGFSQRDAAEFLDMSKRTLQNWEQGVSFPTGLALRYIEAMIGK